MMTTDEKRQLIYETLKKELEKNKPTLTISSPNNIKKARFFYIKDVDNETHEVFEQSTTNNTCDNADNTPKDDSLVFHADIFANLQQAMTPNEAVPENIETEADSHKEDLLDKNSQFDKYISSASNEEFEESKSLDAMVQDDEETKKSNEENEGYYNEDGEFIHVDDMDKRQYKQYLKNKRKEEKHFERVRKDVHKRGYDTTVLDHFEEIEEIYDLSNAEIDQIRAAGFINQDGFYSFIPPFDYSEIKRESMATRNLVLICGAAVICAGLLFYVVRTFINLF